MEKENKKISGYMCVLGGMLIHLSYGFFYTIGNFAPYIIDYMIMQKMSVKHTSAVWLTSLAISFEAVGMPLGGIMAKRFGARRVVLISCIIHSGSIALTHWTMQWNFIAVVFSLGVLLGFGMGFGYAVIISVAAMWFPSRRGLIVGLIVGGFGAGALIFTPIQTSYINPTNIPVNNITRTFDDPVMLRRVPKACIVLAGIVLTIQLTGLSLFREKSANQLSTIAESQSATEKKENDHEIAESENLEISREIEVKNIEMKKLLTLDTELKQPQKQVIRTKYWIDLGRDKIVDIPPSKAIRTPDFYLLWTATVFAAIPITIVASLYKLVGMANIADDRFLAVVAMVASMCNACGRVIWGFICDRFSFKVPMCMMLIFWTAFLITFPHITIFAGIQAKVIYVYWVASLYFCFCGTFIFIPTATEVLFGPVNLAVNYGLVYNAFIVGSMISSVLLSLPTLAGNLIYAFGIAGIMSTLALVFTLIIGDQRIPGFCWYLNYSALVRRRVRRSLRRASSTFMRRISESIGRE